MGETEWENSTAKHKGVKLYPERLLDHFQNPRHVGVLAPPALVVQVENPACGDILKLSARFESGRVAEAAFQVRGCAASIAAGSALAEWLHGQSIEELKLFREATIDEALGGLPTASRHAAALCASGVSAILARIG